MSDSENWDDDDWTKEPPIKQSHTNNKSTFDEGLTSNKSRNTSDRYNNRNKWGSNSNGNIIKEGISIPRESIGRIIGRRGCNIQNLQQEFNVRIQLSDNNVEVSGKNKYDIQDAIAKIKQQAEKQDYKSEYHSRAGFNNSSSPSRHVSQTANVYNKHSNRDDIAKKNEFCLPNGLIDWDTVKKQSQEYEKKLWAELPPLVKNVYKEHPEVANMEPMEVEKMRYENNRTTVKRIFTDESDKELEQAIPNPIWKFEHCFAEYPEIMEAIKEQGFKKPSPIQTQAWPVLLKGENMIGIAQTGTGKTLAFLLPALIHIDSQPIPRSQRNGPNVLIVAPTRELALQIEKEANKYPFKGMKVVCIYGGGSRQDQIERVENGVEIIVCTPGRLNDLYSAKIIDVKSITYIVLDEADRMLDMGFEPQIRRFMVDIRPDRQIIMTSATWPENVRYLASSYLKNAVQICIGTLDLAATHTVKQVLEFVKEGEKTEKIMRLVRNMDPTDKIIIFCGRKARADDLASDFGLKNIDVQCLHGSKDQWDREQAISDISSGTVRILVATDLASRGLDIDDITHVVNYDFPHNIEEYVHRIGRTGRAGRTGISISYITYQDMSMASHLIKILEEAKQEVPYELEKLAQRFADIKASRSESNTKYNQRNGGRYRNSGDKFGRN